MTRQTPLWLQAGSYAAGLDRRLVGAIWPAPFVSGCAVTVAAGTMNLNIAAGTVVAPAANNTGSVLCYSDAVEVVTSPNAPASGSNRYDLIVCQPRGNDLDGGSNNDFIFSVVSGTVAASPVVPATPAGAVALAQVYVAGGSASLTAGNLVNYYSAGWAPLSRIGSAARATDFPWTGTGESGAIMSVTVAVPAGRKLRVCAHLAGSNSAAQNDRSFLRLRADGGELTQCNLEYNANFQAGGHDLAATHSPAAGSHTYTMTVQGGGAGNYNLAAANTGMALEVFDVGTT